MSCRFCANNRTNPDWELDEEQVFYAISAGKSENDTRIMFVKNPNEPLLLEVSHWSDKSNPQQWQPVGYYYPKFCPECGRKIDEYDRARFDKYE